LQVHTEYHADGSPKGGYHATRNSATPRDLHDQICRGSPRPLHHHWKLLTPNRKRDAVETLCERLHGALAILRDSHWYWVRPFSSISSYCIDMTNQHVSHATIRQHRTNVLHVIGTGRSGTTALFSALLSEFRVGWVTALNGRMAKRIPGAQATWPLAIGPARPSNEVLGLYRRIGFTPEFHIGIGAPVSGHDVTPEIAANLRAEYQSLGGSRRRPIVIKSTNNVVRVAALHAIDPSTKFVNIVRDPRAVASSLLRTEFWPNMRFEWRDGTPSTIAHSDTEHAALAAQHWAYRVRAGQQAARDVDHTHLVLYESFVQNPPEVLRGIGEFAQLRHRAVHSPYRRLGGEVSTRSTELWRERLTSGQIRAIEEETSALMEEFGYSLE